MSKISEQDALDQMQTLRLLGETEQAMEEVRGYSLDEGMDDNAPDEHYRGTNNNEGSGKPV